ncbi:MAG: bifunctional pyr operon transcriptional regulator/uracil phosphoribosyltransferase PyrR [Bacteroidetes bacterium]|nr:bifunctional pyr operon transcriptional regulator/uracil phosphoribosyltransferase PyrR [Bacteroidota bacterium]
MPPRIILDSTQFALTIDRLCHQLIENHDDFSNSALIGIQPRGIYLSERLHSRLKTIIKGASILHGKLDVAFYRDDFRRGEKPISANVMDMDFLVEGKKIVLIDDVLYTGRTVRAALDALLDFGRPKKVELLVLIDRRFSRQLPIQPEYVGKTVDSVKSERVSVGWMEEEGEDKVVLFNAKQNV